MTAFACIIQIILSAFHYILALGVCSNCIRKKILARQYQDQLESVNLGNL